MSTTPINDMPKRALLKRTVQLANYPIESVPLPWPLKKRAPKAFATNMVVTQKFSPAIKFLPLFLWSSFRQLANTYFLVVSLLQCVPQWSATKGQPYTLFPLLFVLFVDAVFQIIEDVARYKADKEANSTKIEVYVGGSTDGAFVTKTWRDVVVGDILKINGNDPIPADIVVLASSDATGQDCFIETKSLDGETNQKIRTAVEASVCILRDANDPPAEFKMHDEMLGRLEGCTITTDDPRDNETPTSTSFFNDVTAVDTVPTVV